MGRPARDIDLAEVKRLAALGMKQPTKIAACLGIPKQTMLGPKHAQEVRDAIEDGQAMFELNALEEYQAACRTRVMNPLLIFRMKQLGWTDKLQTTNPGANPLQEILGARERLRELVEKYRRDHPPEATPAPEVTA